MTGRIETHLRQLGIVIPAAPGTAGNYVPWVRTGNLVYVAGQGPVVDGQIRFSGKLGRDLDVAAGREAARTVALNIVAQVRAACSGDLDRVRRCVRLGGYVAGTDDFTQQAEVMNGASDLMVEIFGEAGKHTRLAVGCNALPRGMAVEIDAVFEVA